MAYTKGQIIDRGNGNYIKILDIQDTPEGFKHYQIEEGGPSYEKPFVGIKTEGPNGVAVDAFGRPAGTDILNTKVPYQSGTLSGYKQAVYDWQIGESIGLDGKRQFYVQGTGENFPTREAAEAKMNQINPYKKTPEQGGLISGTGQIKQPTPDTATAPVVASFNPTYVYGKDSAGNPQKILVGNEQDLKNYLSWGFTATPPVVNLSSNPSNTAVLPQKRDITLQDLISTERQDVLNEAKRLYPGQDPFKTGTPANTYINDWWNRYGSKEMPNINLVQPMSSAPSNNPAGGGTTNIIDEKAEIAKQAGAAGVSLDDYIKMLSSSGNLTADESAQLKKDLGIDVLETSVFNKPSKTTQELYDQAYTSAGLAEVKNKITELNNIINQKRQDLNKRVGTINENPWMTESSRLRSVNDAIKMAQDDIGNVSAQINQYKDLYNTGLAEVNNFITRNQNDFATEQNLNKAKLDYLTKQAEEKATSMKTGKLEKLYRYIPDFLKAKTATKEPKTIGNTETGFYAWNADKGKFEQVVAPKAEANEDIEQNAQAVFEGRLKLTGVPVKIRSAVDKRVQELKATSNKYDSEFEARVDYDQELNQLQRAQNNNQLNGTPSEIIAALVNSYGKRISPQEIQATVYNLFGIKPQENKQVSIPGLLPSMANTVISKG